jgi:VIT1/CCC1 family predicted Fe2+/Mn2+ transporter
MSEGTAGATERKSQRELVLDPVDRASEAIFGIIMALGATGSMSVATAGAQQVRTMLLSALGANLAWGIADAVMYLLSAVTEQNRRKTLLLRLQGTRDDAEAHRLITEALPDRVAGGVSEATLEAIRQRLVAIPVPRTTLQASDYAAAAAVCAIVVLATLPVAVPYLLIHDPRTATAVSRALALVDLFACGSLLGHYSGGTAWKYGVFVSAIGVALVLVIKALGG